MSDAEKILSDILSKDPRYRGEAYRFVFEALDHTVKRLGERRHVSGKELLEGIRDLALDRYGGLARTVFSFWGIHRTADFGEIVFNLVERGLMGKTEQDTREDFRDVYDLDEVFSMERVLARKGRGASPG